MRLIKPILVAVVVLALSLAVSPLSSSARTDSAILQQPAPHALDAAAIAAVLRPLREKHAVAAIAAAIVTSRGLQAAGVVGLRKAGTEAAATIDDRWHLGSDTKAMTAALLGRLVERGLIKWDTKPAEVFPELAAGFDPGYADVTVLHLLSHRAGLQANLDWGASAKAGTLLAQRLDAVKKGFAAPPLHAPGSRYLYSNLGYVVAGTIAERLLGKTWEEAIVEEVFAPLEIKAYGFGGTGTPGQVDQPWGHSRNGKPLFGNGPLMDNPPVLGAAGRAHMTIDGWARFVADQLRGARGKAGLLKPETYKILHTPPFGGDYALGWATAEREWGGGKVLNHNGSNTMNFAVVWAAPARDFAVLVCINQDAAQAADEVAGALIKLWQQEGVR